MTYTPYEKGILFYLRNDPEKRTVAVIEGAATDVTPV